MRSLVEGLEVEDRIVTLLPINEDLEVCFGLERASGDSIFSARDEAILEAVASGLMRPLHHFLSSRGLLPGQDALTEREQLVLRLLLGTMMVKEIAEELDLSIYYVRDVIQKIYRKMGVRGRIELMARWFGPIGS
jgi:DNA-binding NarL/FixJ family response regulator